MQFLKRSSPGTQAALLYITVGALTVIWTTVWYVYLYNHPPQNQAIYYICSGLLVTGAILLVIGLAVGRIGQSAREADQPPKPLPPESLLGQPGTVATVQSNGTPVAPGAVANQPMAGQPVMGGPVATPVQQPMAAAPAATVPLAGRPLVKH